MKTLSVLSLMLLLKLPVIGQNYSIPLNNASENKVIIAITGGDLQVIGYEGEELKITTEDEEVYEKPEKAKGLKSLYNNTEDNTGIGLSVIKEGNLVKIVSASRHDSDYVIRIPRKAAISIEQVNWGDGDMEIIDCNGELEIKSTSGDIILNNVTGPVVANSTSGDLISTFTTLTVGKPTAISMVSGDVDISLPVDTRANFKLQSISGEIYTDFDIVYKKDNEKDIDSMNHVGGGYSIEGAINGGGTDITIKTISGDIFIRKVK